MSQDLVKQFCCSAKDRIGKDGAHQIKAHPFFEGIPWDSIRYVLCLRQDRYSTECLFNRSMDAPISPNVKSVDDTSNFDDFDEEKTVRLPCIISFHANPHRFSCLRTSNWMQARRNTRGCSTITLGVDLKVDSCLRGLLL